METIKLEVMQTFKKNDSAKLVVFEDSKKYEFKTKDEYNFKETILFLIDLQEKDTLELLEANGHQNFSLFVLNIILSVGDRVFYLRKKELEKLLQTDHTLTGSLITNDVNII